MNMHMGWMNTLMRWVALVYELVLCRICSCCTLRANTSVGVLGMVMYLYFSPSLVMLVVVVGVVVVERRGWELKR